MTSNPASRNPIAMNNRFDHGIASWTTAAVAQCNGRPPASRGLSGRVDIDCDLLSGIRCETFELLRTGKSTRHFQRMPHAQDVYQTVASLAQITVR